MSDELSKKDKNRVVKKLGKESPEKICKRKFISATEEMANIVFKTSPQLLF